MNKENDVEACCNFWNKNIDAIHWGLKMAAMNGNPTKLDPMVFCPWCGKKLENRKPLTNE